ncbi:MAG TPA: pilus assembly protein TadG-related protein [Pyrinomonadaceae bacterium]|nr:pilus assembly protein TadG-related protein [Pyrinomonadaceae bacterium]
MNRSKGTISDRKNERGSVLAMAAIGMTALLLAVGLAIDISHFYTAKAELQNAADAAAIAAASQLNSTSGGIRSAVAEATKALNKYDFNKNSVTLSSADIGFGVNLNGSYVSQASAEANAGNIRFVKVTIPPKPVNVTFAALILGKTQNISASATAGLSVGLTMNKFYTAYTFIESASQPLVKGQVYTLSAKAWNDSSPMSYRVLQGSNGDLITTGTIHAYGYIGSSYSIAHLVSSEMCRYTKIGTNTRFGDYTVHPSANATDEPPDTIIDENISYQQYTTMQGNGVVERSDGVRNRRVMTLPIAMNTTYNTGAGTVTADRLSAFFIRSKVGPACTLQVEFIGAPVAVPDGTYQPGLTPVGDLSIPVLYK